MYSVRVFEEGRALNKIFEDMMKEKYPEEFECGKRIAEYIEVETRSKITRMEMTYLAIHIKRVTMAEE